MEAVRLTCQIMVLALFVFRLLATVKWNIEGRPAIRPSGFQGVLGTLIARAVVGVALWLAGTFSLIF